MRPVWQMSAYTRLGMAAGGGSGRVLQSWAYRAWPGDEAAGLWMWAWRVDWIYGVGIGLWEYMYIKRGFVPTGRV